MRAELRAKLVRGGAVRAAGQVTAGRAAMWQHFAVQADCGPSYGLSVANFAVRADCGPSYCGAGCGLRFPARAGP